MSGKCFIGILDKEGFVEGVYCHLGGKPSNVGGRLLRRYSDVLHVRRLIALGDIRQLGDDIHLVEAFHRDLKQSYNEPASYSSMRVALREAWNERGYDFMYVFIPWRGWVFATANNTLLRDLTLKDVESSW